MNHIVTSGTHVLTNLGHQVIAPVPATANIPDRGRPVLFQSRGAATSWCRSNPDFHMKPVPWNPQPLALLH